MRRGMPQSRSGRSARGPANACRAATRRLGDTLHRPGLKARHRTSLSRSDRRFDPRGPVVCASWTFRLVALNRGDAAEGSVPNEVVLAAQCPTVDNPMYGIPRGAFKPNLTRLMTGPDAVPSRVARSVTCLFAIGGRVAPGSGRRQAIRTRSARTGGKVGG